MSNETLEENPPVDFTDAPVAPVTEDETAEPVAGEAEDSGKRGRPRDPKAVERDEAVLGSLAEGPLTRDAIATKLGIEGNHAYLSLWRLKKAGQVVQGVGRVWQLPDYVAPVVEPVTEEVAGEEAPAAE